MVRDVTPCVVRGGALPTWLMVHDVTPASCVQENERTKDLVIEQRFHRTIIGQKGERIREIRDKFPEVQFSTGVCASARTGGLVGIGSTRLSEFLPASGLGLSMISSRLSSTFQTQHKKVILSN